MANRFRGIRAPATRGGVVLGRKLGAGRGDVEELGINELQGIGVASGQQVASAVANGPIYMPLQNGGILILNSDGETIPIKVSP